MRRPPNEGADIDARFMRLSIKAGRCLGCGLELPETGKALFLLNHWQNGDPPIPSIPPVESPIAARVATNTESGDAVPTLDDLADLLQRSLDRLGVPADHHK